MTDRLSENKHFFLVTSQNGNDWHVTHPTEVISVRREVDTIQLTADVPMTGIHAWPHDPKQGCACQVLFTNPPQSVNGICPRVICNGIPWGVVNIVSSAPEGKYHICTARNRPTASDDHGGGILGTYGTINVTPPSR